MNSSPGRTHDVAALTKLAAADVFKKGRLAARLVRDKGSVRFEYDPRYLAESGPAVATTLPLTQEPVVTAREAVPTYFAGLLPEGRRLSGLRRAVKTSADDDLTLLLAVGLDPVGDVQIVPAGAHPTPAEPLIQVDKAFEEVTFSQILHAAGVIDPVALAGVQDKASARMISVPVEQGDKRYRVICCLAAGLSASAHPVQHEQNYTVVVFLKQANGVLPAAPLFGPSPARQGSAPPLRALDRLLPTQEPGLYRRGRPHGVRRPQEPNELCCYFKSSERVPQVIVRNLRHLLSRPL